MTASEVSCESLKFTVIEGGEREREETATTTEESTAEAAREGEEDEEEEQEGEGAECPVRKSSAAVSAVRGTFCKDEVRRGGEVGGRGVRSAVAAGASERCDSVEEHGGVGLRRGAAMEGMGRGIGGAGEGRRIAAEGSDS